MINIQNVYIFLTKNLPEYPELLRYVPYKITEVTNTYYKIEGFSEKQFPKYDTDGNFIWKMVTNNKTSLN
jgi:hypothetical protein